MIVVTSYRRPLLSQNAIMNENKVTRCVMIFANRLAVTAATEASIATIITASSTPATISSTTTAINQYQREIVYLRIYFFPSSVHSLLQLHGVLVKTE